MVDRLEELLALLEEEEEADEWEDALEMAREAAVPAVPPAGMETENLREVKESGETPGWGEGQEAPAESGALNWMPDVRMPPEEKAEEAAEKVRGADGAGMAGDDGAGNGPTEFLWDELAAAVMGPNGTMVLRRPGAGDVEMAEPAAAAGEAASAELDAAAKTLTAAERGLEGLYRQAAQASRPAAQSLPAEQGERSVRVEAPGRTAELTVDELDRAVRRDSRRYDGGMTLF